MKKAVSLIMASVMAVGVFAGCSKKFDKMDLRVGSDIKFGKYQGEAIEWEVAGRNFLIDEGKVRVELRSKYVIDCVPFDEDGESTWEDCSLRKWLNEDFYNEAFSKSEQEMIADTPYFNIYGNTRFLTDKVYLMSYVPYRMQREDSACEPTGYAKDKDIIMSEDSCIYWSRDVAEASAASTVDGPYSRPFVLTLGDVSGNTGFGNHEFDAEDVGVRPVINVEYKVSFSRDDIRKDDIVTFGSYSGEPLEWYVIDKDKDGLTVLSRYAIDDMKMDSNGADSFEDTALYDWLNDDFVNDAFDSKQQKKIVAFDNGGSVSLISRDTLNDLFHNDREFRNNLYTGYTPAFYAEHTELEDEVLPANKKIVDTFWLSDINGVNGNGTAFNMGRMSAEVPQDMEFSVRPLIRISF